MIAAELILTVALAVVPVDLGLSVKWADCNIGAEHPEEYGRYFAWGEVVGQTWDGTAWSGAGFVEYPKYLLDDNSNLISQQDAAQVLLGDGWRMPTKEDFDELCENCIAEWTCVNGVNGVRFTSKKPGYTDRSIFLPAAGDGSFSKLKYVGEFCFYWSSSLHGGCYAEALVGGEHHVFLAYINRSDGYSIRPVRQ